MPKIKKGDNVIAIAGKDKGQKGVVKQVVNDGSRVVVEGLNLIKRHTKGNPQQNKPGGILEREASFAISNVAIFNASTAKPDRIGFKMLQDGKKVRIFKSTGEVIDI